jgi:hypothetical protein
MGKFEELDGIIVVESAKYLGLQLSNDSEAIGIHQESTELLQCGGERAPLNCHPKEPHNIYYVAAYRLLRLVI